MGVKSWVMLFDDKNYEDRSLTVLDGQDIPNMKDVNSDDGGSGFGDKTSSLKFCIEEGLTCNLYEDQDYGGVVYPLRGTGELVLQSDLGKYGFNDKTSSLKWVRD